MKADLHVHSYYSDGSSSLEELAQMAAARGVTHLGLVDHDTVKGIQQAREIGKQYGVTVLPGVEISAYDFERNRKVHILGYLFTEEATHINTLCEPLLERRHANSLWQIQQLQEHGFAIRLEDVKDKAKHSEVIYKQHIMDCLLDDPFGTPIYRSLYEELFKGNGICARDIEYVDAVDAVRAIKADHGFAVLAHPGQLDSYALIPELVKHGLDGIERNHPDHQKEDIWKVERMATEYGLLMTGGSDFHGNYGMPIEIGEVLSDSFIPFQFEESFVKKF